MSNKKKKNRDQITKSKTCCPKCGKDIGIFAEFGGAYYPYVGSEAYCNKACADAHIYDGL